MLNKKDYQKKDVPCMIFREKAVKVLMTIYFENLKNNDVYIQSIANKVNSPHSYIWLLIKKFEKANLVECCVTGRTKVIKLTEKGEKIASCIKEIYDILSD